MERLDDLELNGKKIIQNDDFFCFGIDSVLLANFVKSSSNKNIIVDLCSGSGVIPVILTQKQKMNKIYAVELQKEMYNLLERNISINSLENKIIPVNEDIKKFNMDKKVDIVTCNPPYKKIGTGTVNENIVKYNARHESLCSLDDVFLCASKVLKDKGRLYLVHKPQRLVDLVNNARKYNLEPKTLQIVYPSINASPCLILIEYSYRGGNELNILPPLFVKDEENNYTKDILEIYGSEEK